jgi:hypothetical protein
MKKRRLVIMGLFAIGTVLVLCSCGGGGGKGKRLTKEQFATKANAICVSFNKANSAAGTPASLAQTIAQFETLIPLYEKRVADLDKLIPPANEEATMNRVVTLEKKRAALAKQILAALKKSDLTTTSTLVKSGNADSKEAKGLYKKLGLTECGK